MDRKTILILVAAALALFIGSTANAGFLVYKGKVEKVEVEIKTMDKYADANRDACTTDIHYSAFSEDITLTESTSTISIDIGRGDNEMLITNGRIFKHLNAMEAAIARVALKAVKDAETLYQQILEDEDVGKVPELRLSPVSYLKPEKIDGLPEEAKILIGNRMLEYELDDGYVIIPAALEPGGTYEFVLVPGSGK